MADNNYVKFLDVLIKETKNKKMKWLYLDGNKSLIKNMHWYNESFLATMTSVEPEPNFNTEDSFYLQTGNTYIVIYVYGNNPASLYVIPSTFKKIVHLSADEYGEHITRLLNIVQSQFPNADQFIKDFIYDKIEEI